MSLLEEINGLKEEIKGLQELLRPGSVLREGDSISAIRLEKAGLENRLAALQTPARQGDLNYIHFIYL